MYLTATLQHKKWVIIAFLCIAILIILHIAPSFFYPLKYGELVFQFAQEYSLDPYLVFAVIQTESKFNSKATSIRNAKGLMQIMDTTGKWAAQNIGIPNFQTHMLYDPAVNIRIGCWYLNRLRAEFKGDWDMVILAYNSGSGKVRSWLHKRSQEELLQNVPYPETRNYAKSLKESYGLYKRYYGGK